MFAPPDHGNFPLSVDAGKKDIHMYDSLRANHFASLFVENFVVSVNDILNVFCAVMRKQLTQVAIRQQCRNVIA